MRATRVIDPQSREFDLRLARAHWLSANTLAWPLDAPLPKGATVTLESRSDGGLDVRTPGLGAEQQLRLRVRKGGLPDALRARHPHLAHAVALELPELSREALGELLQGQVALSIRDADGALLQTTCLQLPNVLDALYAHDEPLGPTWSGGEPSLAVWAPTARSVSVRLYDGPGPDARSTTVPMERDPATGTFRVSGPAEWKDKFYQFEVEVYVPSTGKVERNLVTDPYAVGLGANGERSQLVNLDDPALKPPGWDALRLPALAGPEDIVLYEQHIRDFSLSDPSVPEALRGTYRAYAEPSSVGMRHLGELAAAGLTHVHLLPAFDFATVEERRSQRAAPPEGLHLLPPNSAEQQAKVKSSANDSYNWGYDPAHFFAPEGSYATDPDGNARVLEFRQMVQGLAGAGLRTVMDMVFNHTAQSGQGDRSVLDRIVPGYYHRLNADGWVEHSTCCNNTASEHVMMEKLMVDALGSWAKHYKVSGFRFDLMGHHMKRNLERARATLDALSGERDGIEGREIYLYGEGWNFGEVANNARGEQASQLNMGGTGIGTFNDRLRDAVRGGSAFSGIQDQGLGTGLYTAPNGVSPGSSEDQKDRLLAQTDLVRLSLAGNLAGYQFETASGESRKGRSIDYNGQPAGYAKRPTDTIHYVGAHDNETLFDAVQLKAPRDAEMATRVRMHNLSMSLVLLAQGIPFVHAGDELLRSKSLDRNSYASGDWFNKYDPSGQTNNWGVGLPPAADNQHHWELMGELLGNPELRPSPEHIAQAKQSTLEFLKIRKSSRLWRLGSGKEIRRRVHHHNTGPTQLPGVVAMSIEGDPTGPDLRRALVVSNARPEPISLPIQALENTRLQLHPVQQASADLTVREAHFDAETGTASIPPYTTAVFVEG